jgi:preprotein translocase SecE subunit
LENKVAGKEPSKKAEIEKVSTPIKVSKPQKSKKDKPRRLRLPKFLLFLTAPFRAFGGYAAGSWRELRQVFWPSRRATWGLTLAVVLFTLFFAIVILALDTAFQELFKRILL